MPDSARRRVAIIVTAGTQAAWARWMIAHRAPIILAADG
jgi:hypothetical protein